MSFLGRNPRYAIALLALLFFTCILLFNSNLRGEPWHHAHPPPRWARVSTLDFLRQAESGYQQNVIRGRQDLIRKHGPTISKVNP